MSSSNTRSTNFSLIKMLLQPLTLSMKLSEVHQGRLLRKRALNLLMMSEICWCWIPLTERLSLICIRWISKEEEITDYPPTTMPERPLDYQEFRHSKKSCQTLKWLLEKNWKLSMDQLTIWNCLWASSAKNQPAMQFWENLELKLLARHSEIWETVTDSGTRKPSPNRLCLKLIRLSLVTS